VAFRVRNESRLAVDVSLLFVDGGFGIAAFFPRRFRVEDNRIPPGESITTRRVNVNARTVGWEHMVLIATRGEGQPLDFSALEQPTLETTRNGDDELPRWLRDEALRDSGLCRLLRTSMYGTGVTRGFDEVEVGRHSVRMVSWQVVPLE
jgi:hypothetical protein